VTTLLATDDLSAGLQLRDLSDPTHGPHAMRLLLDEILHTLTSAWGCRLDVQRRDIRLLRSTDPRIAAQLVDLSPWRPVSSYPPIQRDLSIVVDAPADVELLGNAVRAALGPAADDLESLCVVAGSRYDDLPTRGSRAAGTVSGPGQRAAAPGAAPARRDAHR
jgi:hypothetical protein